MEFRPNYGISRIDQPSRKTHGFYVRVSSGGVLIARYFSDKGHGGYAGALAAARSKRDQILAEHPEKQPAPRRENIPQSGVRGITHSRKEVQSVRGVRIYNSWKVTIYRKGRKMVKMFSIERFGEDRALKMAKRYQRKVTQLLSEQSA